MMIHFGLNLCDLFQMVVEICNGTGFNAAGGVLE